MSQRPLLPAKLPFKKSPSGFGFVGLLMYDEEEDKVQCHLDGRWLKALTGSHLKTHGLTDDGYRLAHGLTFNYPLCGEGLSAKRKADVSQQFLEAGTEMRRRRKKNRDRKPNKKPRQVGTKAQSQRNKHGTCDEQIPDRYRKLVEKLGHHPASPEFRKKDRALLEAITRQHQTLNKFRITQGLKPLPRGGYRGKR